MFNRANGGLNTYLLYYFRIITYGSTIDHSNFRTLNKWQIFLFSIFLAQHWLSRSASEYTCASLLWHYTILLSISYHWLFRIFECLISEFLKMRMHYLLSLYVQRKAVSVICCLRYEADLSYNTSTIMPFQFKRRLVREKHKCGKLYVIPNQKRVSL